jgi:uncharacterized protein (TIGR03437 family)
LIAYRLEGDLVKLARWIFSVLLAAVCFSGQSAWGQAFRSNAGFRVSELMRNDDDSSAAVNLGFTVNFFGRQRTQVYVNNNGNITFDEPISAFTPDALSGLSREIVAAFWADVDTRAVRSSPVTFGRDTVNGRPAFGANYQNVGYYDENGDKLNSFQIVLIDRADTGAGNFDIEFNYERIIWETGDASDGSNGLGGDSARVGYSNGSGASETSFELAGSGVNGAFLDNASDALVRRRLGSDVPGRLVFSVRNGQIRPVLSVSPTTLVFRQASAGGAVPSGQEIQLVSNTNAIPYTVQAPVVAGSTNWLTVGPLGSGTTPGRAAVSVAPGSLAAGGYSGSFRIVPTDTTIPAITIPVTLVIGQQTPFAVSNGIVNGASFVGGVLVPGSLFSVFGDQLAPQQAAAPSLPLPNILATTQVLVNDRAVPLIFVSTGQINAQLPFDTNVGPATVVLVRNGIRSAPVTIDVSGQLPGVFFNPATNEGAIQNQNFSANTAANPAAVGSVIIAYMTGLGGVANAPAAGAAAGGSPLSTASGRVTATIDGRPAPVEFAGLAPGFVSLGQVNIRIPAETGAGTRQLIVRVNDVTSAAVVVNVRR